MDAVACSPGLQLIESIEASIPLGAGSVAANGSQLSHSLGIALSQRNPSFKVMLPPAGIPQQMTSQ